MVSFPSDWKIASFGEYVESFKNGYGRRPKGIEDGPIVLRLADVAKGYVDLSNVRRVNMSEDEFHAYRLKQNDLLFTRVNGSRDYVGQCIWINHDYDGVAYNDHLIRVRLKDGLDSEFVSCLFLNEQIRSNLLAYIPLASGGQLTINQTALEEVEIPLPPLGEQRKIAAILSTWDEAITRTGQLIAALQRRKQALMQLLLTGAVRFPGYEDEWEEVRLGSLGTTYSGLSGKSKADFGFGKPYIPYKNIYENSVVDPTWLDYVNIGDGEHQSRVVLGDVFFTVSSETPDEVGMSSVLLENIGECYLNSFCFGFRPHNTDSLVPEYAAQLFRADRFRESVFALAQGSTRYNLSKNELMKIQLQLPGRAEQERIAGVLSHLDTHIKHQLQLQSHYVTQKRGLMQQLLTGAVRVQPEG